MSIRVRKIDKDIYSHVDFHPDATQWSEILFIFIFMTMYFDRF
jgi:hypothetical protein